jgi:hypothetical protein
MASLGVVIGILAISAIASLVRPGKKGKQDTAGEG